jgi:hypothetical protein
MDITESVIQITKTPSLALAQEYTDLIDTVLFKVATIINGNEIVEYRAVALDWAKEHGEGFTSYGEVTQEQLVDWAKTKLTEFEVNRMRDNVEARAIFAGLNPVDV